LSIGFNKEDLREGEGAKQIKGAGTNSSEVWDKGSISSRLLGDNSSITFAHDSLK